MITQPKVRRGKEDHAHNEDMLRTKLAFKVISDTTTRVTTGHKQWRQNAHEIGIGNWHP